MDPGSTTAARRAARGGRLSPARRAALEVFLEWEASSLPADALLRRRMERLAPRDRHLAQELVGGVFRWRGRLDWQLSHVVDRPLDRLDPAVLWILRLGLYQLEHLDRVPSHAICDTAVELAKRLAPRGAASLVNAVLRRAPDAVADLVEPDAAVDPVAHLAARTSHPVWLLERWVARHGFRRALALAASGTRKPSLTLRAVSERVSATDLLADLRHAGVSAEPAFLLPDYVRLPEGWCPTVAELLRAGLVVVQDEAHGLVAHSLRTFAGATLLDMCAAPGGKACHLALLGGDSLVVACDVSPGRVRAVRETARRLGLTRVHAVCADGRRPACRAEFSRVLVDAPCTNTGVLARRPDARWRRGPQDLPRLAALQGELLDAARERVGPGGLLAYSTCSLEPEENEDVIRAYLERHPQDQVVPAEEVLPRQVVSGEFLRTDPAAQPLDGAFCAVIRPGTALRSVR